MFTALQCCQDAVDWRKRSTIYLAAICANRWIIQEIPSGNWKPGG